MSKSVSIKLVFAAIFVAMTMVACEKTDKVSLLDYVPADSPYVFANVTPLPDAVFEKLEPKIDQVLQSYDVLLQAIAGMAMEKAAADGDDSEDAQKAVAVISELSSLMSVDGLRGAGFERKSTSVFYGYGLLPVLRFEVSNGALFESALSRIEEKAGEKMDVATIAGNTVRFIEAKDTKVLVSILEKQVVISVAPSTFSDEQLSELLGLSAPKSSLADSGVLEDISSEYGFDDFFIGYIDIERIAVTVTGGASGLDKDLIALLEELEKSDESAESDDVGESDELSDVCRAEIRSVAGLMPRMVMGYTAISPERFDSQFIVELRDDIATSLATLTAPVPGLGGDPGGLFSYGMSIDVLAMRQFYEAQLDALDSNPFLCEEFADLQAGVEQGRTALQQPVPPMVYDFHGFFGVVQNIEGLNLATQTPPTSVDGRFLLAMDNAPALVSLAAMMSPELAGLNLQADGKPLKLDLPQAQMMGGDVFVALTDNALALSVGDGAETALPAMLAAEATNDGTFFSFSMDAARYYAFLGEAIALGEPDAENPMSPEFQAAMQEMMLAVSNIYDRLSVDVRFTDKGIVVDSSVTVRD
jgi:hypothetical protein